MSEPGRAYLDWNATAPPLEEALAAMVEAGRVAWANPASVHADGRRARRLVEDARAEVAALTGYDPRDVVLTSGGTEANNLALRSAFAERRGGALVLSRVEHPSVLRVADALAREGLASLRWLPVGPGGVVAVEDVERALAAGDVALVALQAVNQETGALQPVADTIAACHARGVRVHVDAVQAYGRVTTEHLFGADTLAVASHKLRGPKGIGALVARPGARLSAYTFGGSQERGLRPGTVDPVACAGFAVALRHARGGPARYAAVAALRDALEAALEGSADRPEALRPAARAPHVTNLLFPGFEGPELVAALDLEGVSASSGSACSAGTSEPSPVLAELVGAAARAAVRFSLGETTTAADVEHAVRALRAILARRA